MIRVLVVYLQCHWEWKLPRICPVQKDVADPGVEVVEQPEWNHRVMYKLGERVCTQVGFVFFVQIHHFASRWSERIYLRHLSLKLKRERCNKQEQIESRPVWICQVF